MFWQNAVEYLGNGECYIFYTFAIVFSTHENLSVGISEALGMKESHFLSKNMFWENVMGYLENGECWSFQIFSLCSAPLKNLLEGNTRALGTRKSHILS